MGVPGLWKILKVAEEIQSLTTLAVQEGFKRQDESKTCYRIGVDTSIWMAEAQAVFRYNHAQSGAHPELRTIFYQLAHLLRHPITVVFVFDGDNRPDVKRGVQVRSKPHWLCSDTKVLIEAFGFSWYTFNFISKAPGEAEAELAWLNELGVIDAVLTSDADALLFGATTVISMPNTKANGDDVSVYRCDAIAKTEQISLTRGGMILIALLSGGDYSSGVHGCGIGIAHALARCGFGDDLLHAISHEIPFAVFFQPWIEAIQAELCTDSRHFLGRRYPGLAQRLPAEFPSLDVVHLYLEPQVSKREDVSQMCLQPKLPDISKLVHACQRLFTFGKEPKSLQRKFRTVLWEGLCVQIIMHEALRNLEGKYDIDLDKSRYASAGFPDLTISPVRILYQKNIGLANEMYKVELLGSSIHDAVISSIDAADSHTITAHPLLATLTKSRKNAQVTEAQPSQMVSDTIVLLVPSKILADGFPHLVDSYDIAHTLRMSKSLVRSSMHKTVQPRKGQLGSTASVSIASSSTTGSIIDLT